MDTSKPTELHLEKLSNNFQEINWCVDRMNAGDFPPVFSLYKKCNCISQSVVRICSPEIVERVYITEDYKCFLIQFVYDYLKAKVEARKAGETIDLRNPRIFFEK